MLPSPINIHEYEMVVVRHEFICDVEWGAVAKVRGLLIENCFTTVGELRTTAVLGLSLREKMPYLVAHFANLFC